MISKYICIQVIYEGAMPRFQDYGPYAYLYVISRFYTLLNDTSSSF